MYYVYFLKLADGWFYVGVSQKPEQRIQSHIQNEGSFLTKMHKVEQVLKVWQLDVKTKIDAELLEKRITCAMRSEYGDKVRGSIWCKEEKIPPKGKLRVWDKERMREITEEKVLLGD